MCFFLYIIPSVHDVIRTCYLSVFRCLRLYFSARIMINSCSAENESKILVTEQMLLRWRSKEVAKIFEGKLLWKDHSSFFAANNQKKYNPFHAFWRAAQSHVKVQMFKSNPNCLSCRKYVKITTINRIMPDIRQKQQLFLNVTSSPVICYNRLWLKISLSVFCFS